MPRTAGARNLDYDETRHRLAIAVANHLVTGAGERASFKDLAASAAVSQATLKYYFGDRDHAILAALDAVAADAVNYLAAMSEVPLGRTLSQSLRAVARDFVSAWRDHDVDRVFANALSVGLSHQQLGPAVVNRVVEPLIRATESLLAVHVERGDLSPTVPLREAALAFLGPLLIALIHQDPLFGASCRPLDMGSYVDIHADLVLGGLTSVERPVNPSTETAEGPTAPVTAS